MRQIYSAIGFAAAGAVTFAMVHPWPIEEATGFALGALAIVMGVLAAPSIANGSGDRPDTPDCRSGEDRELPF